MTVEKTVASTPDCTGRMPTMRNTHTHTSHPQGAEGGSTTEVGNHKRRHVEKEPIKKVGRSTAIAEQR